MLFGLAERAMQSARHIAEENNCSLAYTNLTIADKNVSIELSLTYKNQRFYYNMVWYEDDLKTPGFVFPGHIAIRRDGHLIQVGKGEAILTSEWKLPMPLGNGQ